jgi:hypothetical protein
MRKRVAAVDVSEVAISARWSELAPGAEVRTVDGQQLRVLYPGRSNREAGPDFLDAIIATPDGEVRGAVEIHRRTSDWERHGHGSDPRYAGVVLHVVASDDGAASRRPGGTQLPLLELAMAEAGHLNPEERVPFPCALAGPEHVTRQLALAGDARFAANVARLKERLATSGRVLADQVAFEEVAAALGYSRNVESMRALAVAVPLVEAQRQRTNTGGPQVRAEALLLGAAGLLPSGRHLPARRRRDAYADALERAWPAAGRLPALRAYQWDAGQVRPENAPVRRVVGLAHLALRWPEGGMLWALEEALREPPAKARRQLAALVAVPCPEGYWREHWDFGVTAKGAAGGALEGPAGNETVALVGPSRAADVVVNVLLPLAVAAGEALGNTELVDAAWETYRAHPPLAENWITRLVRQRAALPRPAEASREAMTVRHQQGLIHVFEQTCRDLRCGECPLAAI